MPLTDTRACEEGTENAGRRMLTDIVKRMGKALRLMADARIIARTADKISGEYMWRLAD